MNLRVIRSCQEPQTITVLLLAVWLIVQPAILRAQASQLRDEMEHSLRNEGLVGAVWVTVTPQLGTSLGAAGRRDARYEQPLRVTDRVQVGSVAKTLIAAGVLRLVTEGRLSLDASLESLLPQISIDNPWPSRPIRVRHLLDHTSGLDDARLWQLFNDEPRRDTPLDAGFAPGRLQMAVRYPAGARFSYSNSGFGLLGLVIENLTGQRYESYLDEHLLRPLEMASSTFEFVTQEGPATDTGFAMGHFEKGQPAPAAPSFLRPAMQFTTTAGDMGRFAKFLMSDGVVGGRVFIDSSLLRAMGTAVGTEAAKAGLRIGYGLGLATRERHQAVGRCHAGNTVGYRAMLCIYPDQQKAFFISMNADSEDANYGHLDSLVIASLELQKHDPQPQRPTEVDPRHWKGIYAPVPARFESFAYTDVVLGFTRAVPAGELLVLRPFQGRPDSLVPAGGRLLRSTRRSTPSHALLTTDRGVLAISDGLRTLERMSAWRIVPLWVSLAAGIAGLLYLIIMGVLRAARRSLRIGDPVFAPFGVVILLVVAGALVAKQSLLLLGALTPPNVLLAVASGLLPLASLVGLWLVQRESAHRAKRIADGLALVAVLQWTVVLAMWGLVPMRLWA